MGARNVTIYTCDGRKVTKVLAVSEIARGFSEVTLKHGTFLLCTVCYAAVDWVARFQGITVPPTIHGEGTHATLRKPSTD